MTEARTIPRHRKILPYDRNAMKRHTDQEINASIDMMVQDVQLLGVRLATDFCEFVGVCHEACLSYDAQCCDRYAHLYQTVYDLQEKSTR